MGASLRDAQPPASRSDAATPFILPFILSFVLSSVLPFILPHHGG